MADAPPPKPAPPPFSIDSIPEIPVQTTKKDSAVFRASDQESAIEVYAVDVRADSLLFSITPRTNWVFEATEKRFTGKIVARDHTQDVFATIADQIGADVTPIVATKKYRGATVDIEFTAAPTRDLLRIIADTGRVNIVVAPGELPAVTVRTKRLPWDLVLEVIAARIGYAAVREGNTFYFAPTGTNLEASKKKYTGPSIDLEMREGTVADAVTALRALTPLELGSCSKTKLASFRVKRMPVQQVVKALEIASGEKLTDKTPCPSKPIADEPTTELKLTTIATLGAKRAAVLSHDGAILVAQVKAQPRVKDIGSGYITLEGEEHLQLWPSLSGDAPAYRETAPPPPPLSRTAAVIKRGERWTAIAERLNGDPVGLDTGPWLGTSGTVDIDKQGVRVTVEGEPAPRVVPLGPRP